MQEFSSKILALSNDLSSWNADIFGNVRQEIRQLSSRLAQFRDAPSRLGPTYEETKRFYVVRDQEFSGFEKEITTQKNFTSGRQ